MDHTISIDQFTEFVRKATEQAGRPISTRELAKVGVGRTILRKLVRAGVLNICMLRNEKTGSLEVGYLCP